MNWKPIASDRYRMLLKKMFDCDDALMHCVVNVNQFYNADNVLFWDLDNDFDEVTLMICRTIKENIYETFKE